MTTVVSPTPTMDRIATPDPALQRAELAAFLRTRRERITPEQVGLPSTGRRRTPTWRRCGATRRSGNCYGPRDRGDLLCC